MTVAKNRGALLSDDVTVYRGPRLVVAMALICGVFVGVCIWSFIAARRRRTNLKAGDATTVGR